MDEQADLCLSCGHMSDVMFSHVVAHFADLSLYGGIMQSCKNYRYCAPAQISILFVWLEGGLFS